ncbi:uncharacterized protein METZ01_LOCUS139323, partial [marine metagenome]
MSETLVTLALLSMRFTIPPRALPGPISRKFVTPDLIMKSTVLFHWTHP